MRVADGSGDLRAHLRGRNMTATIEPLDDRRRGRPVDAEGGGVVRRDALREG
jgi:hypothetical protein